MNNRRTLIIAAHLDDETFGLGGSIIRFCNKYNAKDLKIIVLCKGRSESDTNIRVKAFKEIASKLGFSYKIFDFLDLTLDKEDFIKITSLIKGEVDTFCPQVVFTPSEFDLHRDHQITCEATKVACRPTTSCSVQSLYRYKIPAASDWSFSGHKFNCGIDITNFIEKKLTHCALYTCEIKDDNSFGPGSLEGIKKINSADGIVFGFEYAEVTSIIYARG